MKESIIFDLDGTLWDTSEEIEQVWKNVAQNYNIKVDADTIRQIMGYTKNEIIEYLFKGNDIEKYFRDYECSGNTGFSKEKILR